MASDRDRIPAGDRRRLGQAGERAARRRLEQLGYRVLATNFRTRDGEIDIVALDGTQYAFVEVKSRRGAAFGEPVEAVTRAKRRRIIATAKAFLQERGDDDAEWRIDVVAVALRRNGTVRSLRVLRNAVSEEDDACAAQ